MNPIIGDCMDSPTNASVNTTSAVHGATVWDLWFAVIPIQLAISFVAWSSTILSLNRFRGCFRLSRAERAAALVYSASATTRSFAAVATQSTSVVMQISLAFLGSAMGWTGFFIVFNDTLQLPSRQQVQAVLLSLVATGLWEIQHRLVLQSADVA